MNDKLHREAGEVGAGWWDAKEFTLLVTVGSMANYYRDAFLKIKNKIKSELEHGLV